MLERRYIFNLKDNCHIFVKELKEKKPDTLQDTEVSYCCMSILHGNTIFIVYIFRCASKS